MFAKLRQRFHAFVATPSGQRFRREHRLRQAGRGGARSILSIVGALLLLPLGIAMLVLPGPGLLVLLCAAALLGGESLLVARLLDRVDFRASAGYARWRNRRD